MSQHDKPSNQRLDAQMQVLAIAEGLGIPHPMSWTWLEPGQLKLICQAIAKQAAQSERVRAALMFYANPETYFAIGFFPDPPCGKFMEDFSDTGPSYGQRPGKRAREALEASLGVKLKPDEIFEEAAPRDETAPADETNRDKALRREVVIISEARLREMRDQAIKFEGIDFGSYHWHWAAALNELIALREPVRQVETTIAATDSGEKR